MIDGLGLTSASDSGLPYSAKARPLPPSQLGMRVPDRGAMGKRSPSIQVGGLSSRVVPPIAQTTFWILASYLVFILGFVSRLTVS